MARVVPTPNNTARQFCNAFFASPALSMRLRSVRGGLREKERKRERGRGREREKGEAQSTPHPEMRKMPIVEYFWSPMLAAAAPTSGARTPIVIALTSPNGRNWLCAWKNGSAVKAKGAISQHFSRTWKFRDQYVQLRKLLGAAAHYLGEIGCSSEERACRARTLRTAAP